MPVTTIQNTLLGVHGDEENAYTGGVYNMLASFGTGLYKALQKKSPNVKYTYEYIENQKILPHISVGFNASSYPGWDIMLNNHRANIMWSVDSLFYKNFNLIEKYYKFPNFGCICISKDDDEAIKHFLPELVTYYMPLAIDPEIWQSDSTEKTKDIVFLASIQDVEESILNIKNQLKNNPDVFDLYMEMHQYALNNPTKNFWEIYSLFSLTKDNPIFYSALLQELTYLASYQKRIDLVKYLSKSGLNVEIWGTGPWDKYTSGNVKHMGSAPLFDAIEIIKSAKIALNLQPMQILNGIHDRIINSSAANTLVFTDKNSEIFNSFENNLCYIKMPDFEGLADGLNHYLQNDEKRIEKAKSAQKITLQNHTWDNRADELLTKFLRL